LNPGNYQVWVTDNMGCMDVLPFTIGNDCDGSGGIDGMIDPPDEDDTMQNDPPVDDDVTQPEPMQPAQALLSTYPNPSNGEFIHVTLQKNVETETVFMELIDMSGKSLIKETAVAVGNPYEMTLEFNKKLPFGIYILRVQIENEILTQKIVVK